MNDSLLKCVVFGRSILHFWGTLTKKQPIIRQSVPTAAKLSPQTFASRERLRGVLFLGRDYEGYGAEDKKDSNGEVEGEGFAKGYKAHEYGGYGFHCTHDCGGS